jgi:hypothetical protein
LQEAGDGLPDPGNYLRPRLLVHWLEPIDRQSRYWLVYRRWMLKGSPPYYRELLLAAVACVSCRLGLNAFQWALNNFDPVLAHVGNTKPSETPFRLLGLAAKRIKLSSMKRTPIPVTKQLQWRSIPSLIQQIPPPNVLCQVFERLSKRVAKGRNLVTCKAGAPVGLLLDVTDVNNSNEHFQDRICSLYMNAVPVSESQAALANPLVLCSTKDGKPYVTQAR